MARGAEGRSDGRGKAPRVYDPSSVFSMRTEWNFRVKRGQSSSLLYRDPDHQEDSEDP